MKARHNGEEGSCSQFNTSTLSEVIFYSNDWTDTVYIRDVEVEVAGQWKTLQAAFDDGDVVPDNANQGFAPPIDAESRARGYNP